MAAKHMREELKAEIAKETEERLREEFEQQRKQRKDFKKMAANLRER